MIRRNAEKHLQTYFKEKTRKICFLWGPRRSGKTTLLKKIAAEKGVPIFNFDYTSDQEKFLATKESLSKIVKETSLILIDEVQNYPESTRALKILVDEFDVQIIATGSSELRQKTQDFDSLAGRYIEYFCLPLSYEELKEYVAPKAYDEKEWNHAFLNATQIFGSYPELQEKNISDEEKVQRLENILETYVLKDIINIYNLKDSRLAKDILTKIALQVGSEISLRELASSLGTTVVTVGNYLEIFVKNHVLIALPSFKTNARRAISQHKKYYFLDLGIRNILIRDFREMILRTDRGAIFENFFISEMYKKIKNKKENLSLYFYREYNGKEVDLVIEDYYKKYNCYEIKLSPQKVKEVFPLPHELFVIHEQNFDQAL